MPLPVVAWTTDVPVTAKSLNTALYTTTGDLNAPTGILWHAQRYITLEVLSSLAAGGLMLFTGSTTGTRNIIGAGNSGVSNPGIALVDNAGYYGETSDAAFWQCAYTFKPAIPGGVGDGVTAGGWTILCHFITVANGGSSTIDGIGADMDAGGTVVCSGARQKLNFANDACAFFLDLQNVTGKVWQPSVNIIDSASGSSEPRVNSTDSSGETPRFFTIWAGISTNASGYGTPALPAPYTGPYTSATTVGTSGSDTVDLNGTNGIQDPVNFLMNPPLFRGHLLSSQSITNNSATAVTLSGTADVDNYSGWVASTYTVQRAGLYLCHGVVPFAANSTGTRRCGLKINGGTTYWGPGYAAIVAGETIATKTQVFSLQANDTVQLICEQNSGGSLALAVGDQSRIFMTWLCIDGVPSTLWTPPDTTFRWTSGTPGTSLPGLMQTHLANDLNFLVNRPYLMAYQTQPQSGFADNSWNTVVLDTLAGIIHSDNGDNYSGWTSGSSNEYVAQVAGWYLVVMEVVSTFPSGSAQSLRAGILTSTSGGRTPSSTPDRYQELFPSQSSWEPQATAVGLYYLEVGESITPQIYAQNYGGTFGTATNAGVASHIEVCWVSNLQRVNLLSLFVGSLIIPYAHAASRLLAVRVHVGVLRRHLVTICALPIAFSLASLPAALDVDPARDRFEVVRVHASMDPAQVV